jgi:ubiquinone/menaquinone biosynthesis C-methylase UbiE
MNRHITNLIRRAMDTCLPPLVRDNYYFMYPFYRYWFAGSTNVFSIMNFKDLVHSMTDQDFVSFYDQLHSRGSARRTDCSEESLAWVSARLRQNADAVTLLDVGCGRGYCLERFSHLGFTVAGCDVSDQLTRGMGTFKRGTVEQLPFADKSFDVVTCFHTLEHVRRLPKAMSELKRVARRHLYIIVPCQRYFRYTLDLHIHFFYSPAYFSSLVDIPKCQCELAGNDIVYHADLTQLN